MMGELDAMVADVVALRQEVVGTVRAGMIGTTGRWLVPQLFARLRERHPHVHLNVSDGTNTTLEPQLVGGQLDLAVLTMPVPSEELTAVPLFEEDLVLVVAAEHPLASAITTDDADATQENPAPLPLSALADLELLLPLPGTALRAEIDATVRPAGVQLRPSIELDGVGCSPRSPLTATDRRSSRRPPCRSTCATAFACWPSKGSPAARRRGHAEPGHAVRSCTSRDRPPRRHRPPVRSAPRGPAPGRPPATRLNRLKGCTCSIVVAMGPLRIGLLGASSIAPAALVKPARHACGTWTSWRSPPATTGARSLSPTSTGSPAHRDYEALLADPDLDAVYISLPNGLHGRWTLAAIAAGKHVLCEKPFTANATEAETVALAAAAAETVVMEAFHYRYHPLAERIRAIVASGELGKTQRVKDPRSPHRWRSAETSATGSTSPVGR